MTEQEYQQLRSSGSSDETIATKEYKLDEVHQQLERVIRTYEKGLITYVEYIFKQADNIHQALLQGVPFETLNQFQGDL